MRRFILSLGVVVIAGVLQSCAEQPQPLEISAKPLFTDQPPPCPEVQTTTTTTDPPPSDCTLPGRMTGGGADIEVGGAKVTKGLTLHCDITLSNNLEINWGGGNNWHITRPLTDANCIDAPDINPVPPVAPFDTFIGIAVGTFNGIEGYICQFIFADAGEPGGKHDLAAIQISSPSGEVVLHVPLSETSTGNLQAHYDQPHGNKP